MNGETGDAESSMVQTMPEAPWGVGLVHRWVEAAAAVAVVVELGTCHLEP